MKLQTWADRPWASSKVSVFKELNDIVPVVHRDRVTQLPMGKLNAARRLQEPDAFTVDGHVKGVTVYRSSHANKRHCCNQRCSKTACPEHVYSNGTKSAPFMNQVSCVLLEIPLHPAHHQIAAALQQQALYLRRFEKLAPGNWQQSR